MKKYFMGMLILFILTGLTGCKEEEKVASELMEPVGVQLDMAEAKMDSIFNASVYNGEIVPYVEELQFQVDGVLEDVHVALGDQVVKGQILATLDKDDVAEQMEALEAQIAHINKQGEYTDRQLNIDIEIAELELERLEKAAPNSQSTKLQKVDVQIAHGALRQAQEMRQLEVQEIQNNLNTLKGKLQNNQLTAPFDGRIVYIGKLERGSGVQAYSTVICIADESRLYLTMEYISESIINSADKMYTKIGDKEYGIAYVPYDPEEYITKVLSGEEVKTQFLVEAPEGELACGQFAAVVFQNAYQENVLTIPVNALYRDESGRYVYKMDGERRVRCDVVTGTVSDTRVEIIDGLKEGDVVYVKD